MNQTKSIFFLVNGNSKIGFGHVNRCLILAREAKSQNIHSVFLSYSNDEKVNDIIVGAGYQTFTLTKPQEQSEIFEKDLLKTIELNAQSKSPFLVIDSDEIILRNQSFQKFLIHNRIKFMHITVDNKTAFLSTLILNQNVIAPTLKYNISEKTKALLGLEYFILNDKMKNIKPKQSFKEKDGYDILLTFGSADPLNLTAKVINCLSVIKDQINALTVILGPLNKRFDEIELLLKNSPLKNYEVIFNTKEMYHYMNKADIAFTSMGLTFWELILHNIPCISLSGSEREKNVMNFISDKEYCIKLDDGDNFDLDIWQKKLKDIFINKKISHLQYEDLRKSINKDGIKLVIQNIIDA